MTAAPVASMIGAPANASALGSATGVRWPAERFYWSIISVPGWTRAGVVPEALRASFEEDLPVEPDGVHAVGVPLGDGRVVVCGIAHDELSDLDVSVLTLTPEAVPEALGHVSDPESVAARLNLLVGAFEPRPLRNARIRRHVLAAGTVALCGLLIAVGLLRRAGHDDTIAAAAQREADAALATIGPGQTVASLSAELTRLEQMGVVAARAGTGDAAVVLASVLKSWPAQVPSKPQSISAALDGATVSVSTDGDAQAFLQAIVPPPGWTLAEPRLNTADHVTRLTLQFQPATGTKGGAR